MTNNIALTLLYDKPCLPGFTGGWGLSIWIEYYNEVILFDTGWNGEVLLANCKEAGKNPDDISYIVLSHDHWDHVGGIVYLLNRDLPKLKGIVVPSSFSDHFKEELRSLAVVIEIPESSTPIKITNGIYSSGVMGTDIKEHSLFLQNNSGQILIITGCSHPSPIDFMANAKKIAPIFGIAGGFHGFQKIDVFADLKLIIPVHCTKEQQRILDQYPLTARLMKVGETLKIEEITLNRE